MTVAIVTGSSGLVGSTSVRFLHDLGFDVVGIDNDMRGYFFGHEGSTASNTQLLRARLSRFKHHDFDIRNADAVNRLFRDYKGRIDFVVHTAAQPSHDWAATDPMTDFAVNANGTMVLLEATRRFAPDIPFVFMSTNKVYGDLPNHLPLIEQDTRWELDPAHMFATHGIDETLSIDQSLHSVFGASKVAADVLVQEYGRYFGVNTGSFRCGCVTGSTHSGTEWHGFLAYLVKCLLQGRSYTILGHKGKQVRDIIHVHDLVNALWHFYEAPRPGSVYNLGGSRFSNCSVLEVIGLLERKTNKTLNYTLSCESRIGDHRWYISDVRRFSADYPSWSYRYNLDDIVDELIAAR